MNRSFGCNSVKNVAICWNIRVWSGTALTVFVSVVTIRFCGQSAGNFIIYFSLMKFASRYGESAEELYQKVNQTSDVGDQIKLYLQFASGNPLTREIVKKGDEVPVQRLQRDEQ